MPAMKRFITRTLICLTVFTVLLLPAILWDPFKVFFYYKDYYKGSKINLNREHTCLAILNNRPNKRNIANFIIGSSRSQAYKTADWAPLIGASPNTCFHFDGNGLGLYRTANIFAYLDSHVDKLSNVLLMIDVPFLDELENPSDYLYTQPPAISGEFAPLYYAKFFKASLNPAFIFYNVLYKVAGPKEAFKNKYISRTKYDYIGDNQTADIWYPNDREIVEDSIGYYRKLDELQTFENKRSTTAVSKRMLTAEHMMYLKQIAGITKRQQCNLQIVISPLYNQEKFNPEDLADLRNLFGQNNVHDFSGVNYMTETKYNYYESNHYKPYVARWVMKEVYKKQGSLQLVPAN